MWMIGKVVSCLQGEELLHTYKSKCRVCKENKSTNYNIGFIF